MPGKSHYARKHFLRGLVGEGHGKDRSRRCSVLDESGDAAGHHRSFSRSRAREHKQRPRAVLHRTLLLWIHRIGHQGKPVAHLAQRWELDERQNTFRSQRRGAVDSNASTSAQSRNVRNPLGQSADGARGLGLRNRRRPPADRHNWGRWPARSGGRHRVRSGQVSICT